MSKRSRTHRLREIVNQLQGSILDCSVTVVERGDSTVVSLGDNSNIVLEATRSHMFVSFEGDCIQLREKAKRRYEAALAALAGRRWGLVQTASAEELTAVA